MNPLLPNAQALFPQAPKGMKVTGRYFNSTGDTFAQWFTAGGYFKADTDNMQFGSLAKVAALTIDVDAYEWDAPDACKRWGATRDERKAAMRAASEEEVLQWMRDEDFVACACESAAEVGLPALPNRVLYTGQGLCLVYWMAADEGGLEDAWTPLRMKEVIKRFMAVEGESLWWWDKSAKDVGTRLIPVPGTRHRVTGKHIFVAVAHDDLTPLTPWFDGLDAKYPAAVAQKAKKTAQAKAKATGVPYTGNGMWKVVTHDPAKHPVLAVGDKAEECPLCNGSGFKRMVEEHYSCFSCETQFKVIKPLAFDYASLRKRSEGHLDLNRFGHAQWPLSTPKRLLNKARTGSGKTELMKRERMAFAPPSEWHARVLAVSPTIALAKNLSKRLGIEHADAQSSVTLTNDSMACCFASLPAKIGGASIKTLNRTYLMVDEAETTLAQLQGMLKGDKARETYNLLVYAAAHAEKVMLADANAGPVCAQFLADVDAYMKSNNLPILDWKVWFTDAHRHDFRYIKPLLGTNKKGEQITVASSDAQHKGLILSALNEGKKLAIYVPGRDTALAYAVELRKKYPALLIKTVVRNLSNDTQHDLSEAGLTADVLIYNNAMATGVSYDAEHYDEVHLLIGAGNVTDGTHVEQAVHRIRKPKCKHFFISGTIGTVINDWRCDRDAHLSIARKSLEAGTKLVQHADANLTLTSDFMASAEAQRLAFVQATVLAGRFARGWRWVMEWLSAHHSVTHIDGECSGKLNADIADTRDVIAQQEARAIAQAAPLTDGDVDRVEAKGAETVAEYHAYKAAKMTAIYGDGFAKADEDERAKVALETKKSRLAQKARVWAAVGMVMNGGDDFKAVAKAEVRANKSQTTMTAQVTLPTALCVLASMKALSATFDADGRAFISPLEAQGACQAAVPHMNFAGIKPREDLAQNPFKQLSTLLGFGGLPLHSVKVGPKNARTRVYFITLSDIERMNRLSAAFKDRWLSGAEADTEWKSCFAAA